MKLGPSNRFLKTPNPERLSKETRLDLYNDYLKQSKLTARCQDDLHFSVWQDFEGSQTSLWKDVFAFSRQRHHFLLNELSVYWCLLEQFHAFVSHLEK